MPLLAPADTLNSICSSKAPNSSSVMMSPPPPLAVTASSPFANDQPLAGNPSAFALRQPLAVLPSHSSRQPCAFSSGSRLLGRLLRMKMPMGGAALEVLRLHLRGSSRWWCARPLPALLMLCTCRPKKPLFLHIVDDIRRGPVIDPHAQARTDGFDAVVIPLAELVERLGRRIHLAGVEPAALRLFIDAAAPLPLATDRCRPGSRARGRSRNPACSGCGTARRNWSGRRPGARRTRG